MKYFLLLLATLLSIVPALADPRVWDPQGLPIRVGEHVNWNQDYARAEDGTTLIVWSDARNGNYDVFAQALTANFDSLWCVTVCTHPAAQKNVAVCAVPDGWIIAWTDDRNGTGYDGDRDFCVQKLDAQGNLLWDSDGVLIVTGDMPRDVDDLSPGSDGSGGAIIAFSRHISTCSDVYAQRVDQNGQIVWPEVLAVAAIPDCSQDPIGAVSDTNGDLLVAWSDCRGSYGARITPGGEVPWGVGGRYLGYGVGYNPATILDDGAGGFYLGWTVSNHTCAQHIGSDGSRLWDSTGVRVCTDSLHSQIQSAMALSRNNGQVDGLVFAWQDTRFGQYYDRHIYAQKISLDGTRMWANDGVRISLTLDNITPSVESDGAGGAVVGWLREEENQAAQHVNASGVAQWTTYGVDVTTGTARQERSVMLLGNDGNISMLWPDAAGTASGIRAQRLQIADGARMLSDSGRTIIDGIDGSADTPQSVALGGGRVAMVWTDGRGSVPRMIYYQIINSAGEYERTVNGEPLTPGLELYPGGLGQHDPKSCPEGSGGFFVAFEEQFAYSQTQLKLAHVGNDGELITPQAGSVISGTGSSDPWVAPDGVGGCYATYFSNDQIRMRRYDREGIPVWSNPLGLTSTSWPSVMDVFSEGGSCTVAYLAAGVLGRVACVDSSRNLLWDEELSNLGLRPLVLKVAPDGSGGVYAVWTVDGDSSSQYDHDVYAQRFDSTGAWMWGELGLAVYVGDGDQYSSSIAVSPSGDLYIAWSDDRNDPQGYYGDVYAQKISPDGDFLWPEGGLPLCLTGQAESDVQAAVDGTGGLFVMWTGDGLRGAHVDSTGGWNVDPYWEPQAGGLIIDSNADWWDDPAALTADGLDGWMVAWPDRRLRLNNYSDTTKVIFAQRIVDMPLVSGKPQLEVPSSFNLTQNYPNPFNPTTVFEVNVPMTARVTVKAYNILGREVETLADRVMAAGTHRLNWECADCASGTYLIVLSAPHTRIVREAVLLK